MGLAYTEKVVLTEFAATTSAEVRDGLHAAVLEAGWTIDTVLTNGVVYTIQSPQDLVAKVRIEDTGRSIPGVLPCIDFQILSYDGTKQGFVHDICYGTGLTLQAHANQCQIFISRPGVSETRGASVAGGIPHIPPEWLIGPCAADPGTLGTVRAFWSCGDNSGFFQTDSFREGYRPECFSTLHNDDLIKPVEGSIPDVWEMLRLVPVTWTYDVDFYAGTPSPMRWLYSEDPLFLDPLIAWGASAPRTNPALVRGQLWDSVIVSIDNPLEHERAFDGRDWVNYSHAEDTAHGAGTFFCSLYLRKPDVLIPALEVHNVAY